MARRGMVDALEQAGGILVDGGVLVDARPDSRVSAHVLRGNARGPIIGMIGTQRETKTDDLLSDRAVEEVVRRGRFSRLRRGRFWHAMAFGDVNALQAYLDEHARFSRRVRWRVPAMKRGGEVFIERPVRFEILERR